MSNSWHRFDTGFVPTAKPDRDAIIVTRNSPLISAVSRKRSGEYLIWGGSFIGGGGCREVSIGIGANGFYLKQTTGDSGSGARLGSFEEMTAGVGPGRMARRPLKHST